MPKTKPTRPADTQSEDARAQLDALRHQAGDALTGNEVRARHDLAGDEDTDEPPLDWRLTPRNVAIQFVVIAVFAAAAVFLGWLVWDGVSAIFGLTR